MKIITNTNTSEDNVLVYCMEEHGYAFCELSYYENERHSMFLSNLNVEEQYRRMGMATELISIVSSIAKKKGCKYIYLHTVDENSWITYWYKRLGFIQYNKSDDGADMFKILF